jgi:hypothetical protein
MTTTPASNDPERIEENIGSFFRALNAPFVATPFLNGETSAPIPRVGNPEVPPGHEPLALPIFTSTGEWEWINEQTFYDIHELAVLHGKLRRKFSTLGHGIEKSMSQTIDCTGRLYGHVELEIVRWPI